MAHDIIMPALGMAQETGTIVAWKKKLGDAVKASDIVMEIETDKATVEIEAGRDGFITAIRAEAGVPIPVGQVVAVVSDERGAAADPEEPSGETAALEKQRPEAETPVAPPAVTVPQTSATAIARDTPVESPPPQMRMSGRVLASPKARRLAHEQGIDLARLVRSGVEQPIHVSDLARARPVSHAPPLTLMRASIPAEPFTSFLAWLEEEAGVTINSLAVWSAFAAASLRAAARLNSGSDLIVQASRFVDDLETVSFRNPDQKSLSEVNPETEAGEAGLAILDLTDTPLIEYRPAGDAPIPQLTIGSEPASPNLDIALVFDPELFSVRTALSFLKDLNARAEQPLRHLL